MKVSIRVIACFVFVFCFLLPKETSGVKDASFQNGDFIHSSWDSKKMARMGMLVFSQVNFKVPSLTFATLRQSSGEVFPANKSLSEWKLHGVNSHRPNSSIVAHKKCRLSWSGVMWEEGFGGQYDLCESGTHHLHKSNLMKPHTPYERHGLFCEE